MKIFIGLSQHADKTLDTIINVLKITNRLIKSRIFMLTFEHKEYIILAPDWLAPKTPGQ